MTTPTRVPQVHAGVAKPDAGVGGRKRHLGLGAVVQIAHRGRQVVDAHLERCSNRAGRRIRAARELLGVHVFVGMRGLRPNVPRRDQMSLMGFAPWYAGRLMGLAGRGRRWLYGSAVYDSSAWLPHPPAPSDRASSAQPTDAGPLTAGHRWLGAAPEHVEARRGADGAGHGLRVVRVDDAQGRLDGARRDAGLGAHRLEVKDRRSRRLAARA